MIGSLIDYSHEAKFTEAVAKKVYYGPVYFRRQSEMYMTLALAGFRRDAGVSIAEVNLKLPDSSFQSDFSDLAQVQAVLPGSRTQRVEVARDVRGREVLTANAAVVRPDWFVFVEQPTAEIDAPAIGR